MKMLTLFLAAAIFAPLPVFAAQESPMTSVPPGDVDGATGKKLADAGAVVFDVRTPEEYAAGHVRGAKNIPYDQIARRAAEIGPPTTPVVLYCRSGRRSGVALESLKKLGYAKLWNAGGYDAWPKE